METLREVLFVNQLVELTQTKEDRERLAETLLKVLITMPPLERLGLLLFFKELAGKLLQLRL